MTELNMNAPLTESTGRTMAAEQVLKHILNVCVCMYSCVNHCCTVLL